jgi:hypothetical protein
MSQFNDRLIVATVLWRARIVPEKKLGVMAGFSSVKEFKSAAFAILVRGVEAAALFATRMSADIVNIVS